MSREISISWKSLKSSVVPDTSYTSCRATYLRSAPESTHLSYGITTARPLAFHIYILVGEASVIPMDPCFVDPCHYYGAAVGQVHFIDKVKLLSLLWTIQVDRYT